MTKWRRRQRRTSAVHKSNVAASMAESCCTPSTRRPLDGVILRPRGARLPDGRPPPPLIKRTTPWSSEAPTSRPENTRTRTCRGRTWISPARFHQDELEPPAREAPAPRGRARGPRDLAPAGGDVRGGARASSSVAASHGPGARARDGLRCKKPTYPAVLQGPSAGEEGDTAAARDRTIPPPWPEYSRAQGDDRASPSRPSTGLVAPRRRRRASAAVAPAGWRGASAWRRRVLVAAGATACSSPVSSARRCYRPVVRVHGSSKGSSKRRSYR